MSDQVITVAGSTVPRARRDVAAVVLDGEAVIHHAGRVHALDPTATLVWQCCDGEASVDAIAGDLAEVFARPLATMREDVAVAVAELARLDLVRLGPAEEAGTRASAPDLLRHPPGSCASCAEKDWATRSTVRIGPHRISVGTDSARAEAAVRAVLAAHLESGPGDDGSAPPFFALTFPDPLPDHGPGEHAPQGLYLLHRADVVVARSRRPDAVVRALAGHLATYGDLPGLGLATVNGIVVARDGFGLVVPEPEDPIRYRYALAGHGVLVADLPVAIVDPAKNEVVVGAPGLRVDESAISALAAEAAAESGGPEALPWGRYRLLGFCLPAPATPAAVLLQLGPVRGDHRDHDAAFAALARLTVGLPVVEGVAPDAIDAFLPRS